MLLYELCEDHIVKGYKPCPWLLGSSAVAVQDTSALPLGLKEPSSLEIKTRRHKHHRRVLRVMLQVRTWGTSWHRKILLMLCLHSCHETGISGFRPLRCWGNNCTCYYYSRVYFHSLGKNEKLILRCIRCFLSLNSSVRIKHECF